MNETTVLNEPPSPSPPRKSCVPIAIGFLVGILPWVPALMANRSEDYLFWLITVPFVSPVIGAIMAIIRPTRRFGLGALLASGVGWLVLGAMCGGLIK